MTYAAFCLGNSNSTVSIIRGSASSKASIEVVANEEGDRLIPSILAFHPDSHVTFGAHALLQMHSKPKSTIQNFLVSLHECENIASTESKCLSVEGEEQLYSLRDVIRIFIQKLLETAENYLSGGNNAEGNKLSGIVLSIPDFLFYKPGIIEFFQNVCVSDLGVVLVQVLDHSSCGVLAYEDVLIQPKHEAKSTHQNVMVLDVGASNSRVSLYRVGSANNENHCLSLFSEPLTLHGFNGNIFDSILYNHFRKEANDKLKVNLPEYSNIPSCVNSAEFKAANKLLRGCEALKKALSLKSTAPISIESLISGLDFVGNMTRFRFENLMISTGVLKKFENSIKTFVQTSGLSSPNDISKVLLLGGASKIPKVRSTISSIFEETNKILCDLEADEAIVLGAATHFKTLLFDYKLSIDEIKAANFSSANDSIGETLPLLNSSVCLISKAPIPSPSENDEESDEEVEEKEEPLKDLCFTFLTRGTSLDEIPSEFVSQPLLIPSSQIDFHKYSCNSDKSNESTLIHKATLNDSSLKYPLCAKLCFKNDISNQTIDYKLISENGSVLLESSLIQIQ